MYFNMTKVPFIGIASAIGAVAYDSYKKSRNTLQALKRIAEVEVNEELLHKVQYSDSGVLPYVCITGIVQPLDEIIRGAYTDFDAVVHQRIVTEYRKTHNDRDWHDSVRVHRWRNKMESVPFVLESENPHDSSSVKVSSPELAHYLQQSMVEVSKGRRGYHTDESEAMLVTNSKLTAVGELAYQDNTYTVRPPSENGLYYILGDFTREELLQNLKSEYFISQFIIAVAVVMCLMVISF